MEPRKKRLKTLVVFLLCVLFVISMITGCSSGSSNAKMIIWTNMSTELEVIQKYADEWGAQNGYEIEVITQSPSVQQLAQAAGSANAPDAIVGIPNDQLADFVNAGLMATVPDGLYADEDFSDAAIQACYIDGIRYAAPLSVL